MTDDSLRDLFVPEVIDHLDAEIDRVLLGEPSARKLLVRSLVLSAAAIAARDEYAARAVSAAYNNPWPRETERDAGVLIANRSTRGAALGGPIE